MGVPYKASRIYCTGNSPKGATGALAPPPPGIQNEAKNPWIYANQITGSIGYDLCRQASQFQIHLVCLS